VQVADVDDLVGLIAPRPLLLVSATQDPYSSDAGEIVRSAHGAYEALGAADCLEHARFEGGHALDSARFDLMTGWLLERSRA
jgi:hypothetical protein